MRRIFVGLEIADEARKKIAEYIRELRAEFPDLRVSWEKEEKLHLTLKFFGAVEEAKLKLIDEALDESAAAIASIPIGISGTGIFPSKRKARVLWLGVEDKSTQFAKLSERFEQECGRRGFAREEREFNPHLTIARLREPARSGVLIVKHLSSEFPRVGFSVSEVSIFESLPTPQGSQYKILARKKLSDAA
jgi:2'-5' RNA ligase